VAPLQRVGTRADLPAPGLRLSTIIPWVAITGFVLLVSGGIVIGMGDMLVYLFPLCALAVGSLLYWRYSSLYLGFTWWLWLLTPEVRRLVDYQEGYNPQNPIMLAPYLVGGLTFFTLLRHLPKLQLTRIFPFGLVFMGLFYGYFVGIYKAGLSAATYGLINWSVPVIFAFYLVVHWRNYPDYRQAIQRTFVWGVLVIGSYGLLQYFALPAWDRDWMLSAPINSIGQPEPFGVRVFSTLNAPGPFAMVMMAGLLLLSSSSGLLRWPAAGVGYIAFLLSLVRSSWGMWVVGLLFITIQRRRSSPRVLATIVIMGLIALPLLTVGPVAETVNERAQTITNLQQDNSFQARLEFYSDFLTLALLNVSGAGLGSTGLATKLSDPTGELGELANFDSGIMNIPFVLGWPGTLLYVGGLACLVFYAWRGVGSRSDLFLATCNGIVIALLAQLIFSNSLEGVGGMVFWSFLGLSLSAGTYYLMMNREVWTHAGTATADRPKEAIG
jgi:hypothetical protein